ncbi:hypothetical protein D3C85_770470 [compost metagenome]
MKKQPPMKTLLALDANSPDFEKTVIALVDIMLWSDHRGDQFVFYAAGVSDEQISRYVQRVPFKIPQFVVTHYASTASLVAKAAKEEGRKVHIFVVNPVTYEPTASVFEFAGLTIPAVFDPELGPVLMNADIVTICTRSPA